MSRRSRSGGGRPRLIDRPLFNVVVVLAVLVGVGVGGVAIASRRTDGGVAQWRFGQTVAGTPSATPATQRAITMSATGDVILGNAPRRLPARGGDGFFDPVRDALRADLVMGNLEEPLTEDTGTGKCAPGAQACFQFRAPPSYAEHLTAAGFELLNLANNHANDYGPAGLRNTQQALEEQGLLHTGSKGEITEVEVEGLRVAVLGFSAYQQANNLNDIPAAKKIVAKAAERADLVVVQVHMGAEGADKVHVRPGDELFFGENRGDPIRFSHAVVDAGADLVVGHGPHVLRGMEFYRGRLVAYSLGNFAGGGNALSGVGRLGFGGVLKVELAADGAWRGGEFVSTNMNSAGLPVLDKQGRGRELVADLSRQDFPKTGARLAADGEITAPEPD